MHCRLRATHSAEIDEKHLQERPLQQMQPQVACSSAPAAYHGALPASTTAVATRALALGLSRYLRDALSAPCDSLGRNR
jgi:hypothetical protein